MYLRCTIKKIKRCGIILHETIFHADHLLASQQIDVKYNLTENSLISKTYKELGVTLNSSIN